MFASGRGGQSSAASLCTLSYLTPGRASCQNNHAASAPASLRSQRERAHSGTYEDAEIVVLASTADTAQHLSLLETRDAADILG